jgi:hypothetical protein
MTIAKSVTVPEVTPNWVEALPLREAIGLAYSNGLARARLNRDRSPNPYVNQALRMAYDRGFTYQTYRRSGNGH